jgi:hypothetical protein
MEGVDSLTLMHDLEGHRGMRVPRTSVQLLPLPLVRLGAQDDGTEGNNADVRWMKMERNVLMIRVL